MSKQVTIGDPDVTQFFDANRAQFNLAEEAYHIAQIVITPQRDPQVANTTGDDAATPQEAVAKARTIMERLKGGALVPRAARPATPKIPRRRSGAATWA